MSDNEMVVFPPVMELAEMENGRGVVILLNVPIIQPSLESNRREEGREGVIEKSKYPRVRG